MWKDFWLGVLFNEILIEGIMNGVYIMIWVYNEMRKFFDRYIGKVWREYMNFEGIWYVVERIFDEELWEVYF